ncbi:MAG: hypothetical protein WC455_15855 [Dehalococcoidia bacterium]
MKCPYCENGKAHRVGGWLPAVGEDPLLRQYTCVCGKLFYAPNGKRLKNRGG